MRFIKKALIQRHDFFVDVGNLKWNSHNIVSLLWILLDGYITISYIYICCLGFSVGIHYYFKVISGVCFHFLAVDFSFSIGYFNVIPFKFFVVNYYVCHNCICSDEYPVPGSKIFILYYAVYVYFIKCQVFFKINIILVIRFTC